MATDNIQNVLTVFQGIGNRDADGATKYMHLTKYTQHNPFASDGIAGVKEWIARLPREKSPMKTIRAFQDGPYIFAQTVGEVLDQGHFFDLFRLEDGLIVEHWVFSEKAAPPNTSGHTQSDGPTEADRDADTEKNKTLIRDYYQNVHIAGDHSKIPDYVSQDQCIRHEPGVSDGIAAFTSDVEAATRGGKQSRTIDEIKFLFGKGNFVFVAAKGSVKTEPCVYIDIYRVESEKIVEHWGLVEKVPPQAEWKNSNGIL